MLLLARRLGFASNPNANRPAVRIGRMTLDRLGDLHRRPRARIGFLRLDAIASAGRRGQEAAVRAVCASVAWSAW